MMKSPLKYYGGDMNTAKRIVELFPPHERYVEPFCGGMSTLLAKRPNPCYEIASDIYAELINFWIVVKGPDIQFLITEAQKCVYDYDIWYRAKVTSNDGPAVQRALKFMMRYNWSRNGQGTDFCESVRTRRNMPEYVSRWKTQCERLRACHDRLRYVDLYCMDAIELLNFYSDSKSTLFYCDPPFHPDTRQGNGYQHEQDSLWHEKFLLTCLDSSAKIIISGNRCPLYDNFLKDWIRVDFTQINAAGGNKNHRIESFWCNYGKRTRF